LLCDKSIDRANYHTFFEGEFYGLLHCAMPSLVIRRIRSLSNEAKLGLCKRRSVTLHKRYFVSEGRFQIRRMQKVINACQFVTAVHYVRCQQLHVRAICYYTWGVVFFTWHYHSKAHWDINVLSFCLCRPFKFTN
jgi:hypothetical protein